MLSGKDITIDKDGSIILNGDKYPLASQAEIDAIKDDINDIDDTIGDITQTGVTGASVAAQIGVLGAGSVERIAGASTFDIVLSDVSYTAAVFGTISTTPISCIITAVADAQNPLAISNIGTDIKTEATVTFNTSNRTVTITSLSTKKFYVNVYK